ncbi:hypothetical protein EVA_13554, partial [gut metagenome]
SHSSLLCYRYNAETMSKTFNVLFLT